MEQRLALRRDVEIAGLVPEQGVGHGQRRCGGTLAEVHQVVGEEDVGAEGEGDEDHGEEGREDTPNPALVEGQEGEAAGLQVAQDDRGDQIAGDDEEHVDADEAAAEQRKAGMEEQDRQDGDRPQSVDVGAVAERGAGAASGGQGRAGRPSGGGPGRDGRDPLLHARTLPGRGTAPDD
jgi:hypothetical protein